MVKNIRPLKAKIDSAAWLNAVRNQQGSDYQNRVPEATQANLRDTVENLWNWLPGRNQVQDALVDQLAMVLYRNTLWSNPLAVFKMGTLEEGETIEEVMVGLIDAVDYDFDRDDLEKEIFGDAPIEVQSRFHKRNRKDRYKFTLNIPGLRTALLGNQLGSFVAGVMAAPQTSDQWDEYLLMTRLFKEFDDAGAYHIVNVPDVSEQASDAADSRFLLRRLREYRNTLPFISRVYNPAGMPIAATPDELVLFTTAKADAAMDVEALAAAFNIEKAQANAQKIVLPVEHMGIEGVQAILTTNKFFVVADNLITTTSQFNPAKLTTNYWLHHWQTVSASPFAPLIMFNSERPSTTISEVVQPTVDIGAFTFTDANGTVEATALKRGTLYNITVEGVTSPAGGVSALDLDLTGQTSQFTYITNNGGIYVGPDEDTETLTIRATAENGYTETTTRGVKGDLILPWPNGIVIPDTDLDQLEEVTPIAPEFENNVITIPTVVGVQYKDGATLLNNGATITIVANKTITAEARPGKELKAGAPTSFPFVYVP
jgi:hypothetical protein